MIQTEETQTIFRGDIHHPGFTKITDAWLKSLALNHKLPDPLRYMPGMSGKKYRYFINNLVESMPDARYLEIGSWAGSTACSAIYGNKCKITCVDNWSEFGGPKNEFFFHVNHCLTQDISFDFIEQDFRKIDFSSIGKYNIYMFDGPHGEQDQYDGISLVQESLDHQFILIIDDWNYERVRNGTARALLDVGFKNIASIEIITRHDGEHASIVQHNSDWHNGYFIALISK